MRNLRSKIFRWGKFVSLSLGFVIFLSGCAITINNTAQPATVIPNGNISVNVGMTSVQGGAGSSLYGYAAVLLPEDWDVASSSFYLETNPEVIYPMVASTTLVAPNSGITSTGYYWYVAQTENKMTLSGTQNITGTINMIVGSTTGTYSGLEYWVGDEDHGWMSSSTGNITVAVEEGSQISINSCEDLASVNDDLNGDYILTTDLNCSEDGNDILIGDKDNPFTGSFEGQGYTITLKLDLNLYSGNEDSNYEIGPFRRTLGATISNVFYNVIVNAVEESSNASILVTNGSEKIGSFPIGFLGKFPNTAWRIDTGSVDSATVVATTSGFVGPANGTLVDDEDWTNVFSGSEDDDYSEINFNEGFSTSFNNISYSSVFIGSNTYFTFGEGSWVYSSLTPSYPAIPGVHMGAADNSYQRVDYKYDDENTLRVRYEGTNSTSGDEGNPNIVYEVVFYKNQSYLDLYIGRNDRSMPSVGVPTISSWAATGYELIGSDGTWADLETPTVTYKWQLSESGEAEGEWTDIIGANSNRYTPVESDGGKS